MITGAVLAIESSGDSGGAAVWHNGKLLSEAVLPEPKSHGALLVPCISRALDAAAIKREAIGLVVVNRGPGSYAGLRVGVSAAETLGLALDIPVLGVPCLEVMCEEFLRDGDQQRDGVLIPALDARRDEVMAAAFFYTSRELVRHGDDRVLPPGKLHELSLTGTVFGEGARVYRDRFPPGFEVRGEAFAIRPGSVALSAARLVPNALANPATLERKRVDISYFRPVLAKTVAERQAEADAKQQPEG